MKNHNGGSMKFNLKTLHTFIPMLPLALFLNTAANAYTTRVIKKSDIKSLDRIVLEPKSFANFPHCSILDLSKCKSSKSITVNPEYAEKLEKLKPDFETSFDRFLLARKNLLEELKSKTQKSCKMKALNLKVQQYTKLVIDQCYSYEDQSKVDRQYFDEFLNAERKLNQFLAYTSPLSNDSAETFMYGIKSFSSNQSDMAQKHCSDRHTESHHRLSVEFDRSQPMSFNLVRSDSFQNWIETLKVNCTLAYESSLFVFKHTVLNCVFPENLGHAKFVVRASIDEDVSTLSRQLQNEVRSLLNEFNYPKLKSENCAN